MLPQGFECLEYYGLGPGENYCDRKLASHLAIHKSMIHEQHFPFVPPAECGGHDETRWLLLKNENGAALRIASKNPFHFDIHHNTVQDYINATHDHKLPKRTESYLHIDAKHGPIGSEMAWSTLSPAAYALHGGSYNIAFDIECENA